MATDFDYVAGSTGGNCGASEPTGTTTLQWTGITLAAGGSCSLTYQAVVNTAGHSAIACPDAAMTNTATLTFTGGTRQDDACVSVPEVTATISKSEVQDPASYNGIIIYTLLLTSTGGPYTGDVVDSLPSGVTFKPGTTSGSCGVGAPTVTGTPETLTWTNVTASGTCSITYQVDVVLPGTVNTTTSCPNPDMFNSATYGGNSADVCTQVTYGDPTITKAVSNAGPVNNGDTVTYTSTINNPNSSPVTAFAINDNMPTGFTYEAGTAAVSGGCTIATAFSFSAPNLSGDLTIPSGTTACELTYAVLVQPNNSTAITCPVAAGTNVVQMTYTGGQKSANACVSVDPVPANLSIAKTIDGANPTGAAVNRGDTVTYTVTLTNSGGVAASVTAMTDTLGADLTFGAFVSSTCSGVTSASASGQTVNFTTLPFSVNGGSNCEVLYSAVVMQGDAGTSTIACPNPGTTNLVSVTTSTQAAQTDTVCTPVNPAGALTIEKTIAGANPTAASVARGSTVTYTLTLTNAGGAAATTTSIVDTLGANLTYVGSSVGGTCSPATLNNQSGQILTFDNVTVNASSNCTITYEAVVMQGDAGTTVIACPNAGTTNSVVVASAAGGGVDAVCTPVDGEPDLSIAKTIAGANPTAAAVDRGDTVIYTLTLTNAGGADATTTSIVDTLGADLTFDTATVVGGTCSSGTSSSASPMTFNNVTVTAGTNCTITYGAIVSPAGNTAVACADAALTNSVSVSTSTQGPLTDAVCTPVNPEPGALSIAKTINGANPTAASAVSRGDTVIYTLTITNSGGSPATTTSLVDTLGAGLSFDTGTTVAGTCGLTADPTGSNPYTFANVTVPANDSCTVTYGVVVNPTGNSAVTCADASVTNAIVMTSAVGGGNDAVCQPVDPEPGALSIAKTINGANPTAASAVSRGDTVIYTLTITNSGGSPATTTSLVDTLGAGLSFDTGTTVAGTCGLTADPSGSNPYTFANVTVAANDSCTVTYGVVVNPTGNTAVTCADASVTNAIVMTSAVGGGNDAVCQPVDPEPGALSIAKTINGANPTAASAVSRGDTVIYTLTITNSGGSPTLPLLRVKMPLAPCKPPLMRWLSWPKTWSVTVVGLNSLLRKTA